MKFTLLSALLSVVFLIGQSHAQDTKRVPASVRDACGLQGSIEERIEDCSEQKKGFALVTRTKRVKKFIKTLRLVFFGGIVFRKRWATMMIRTPVKLIWRK